MLPKHLDSYRSELRAKEHLSPQEGALLEELEDLAGRGGAGSVISERLKYGRELNETKAWGGDPNKCPVCGQ